MVNRHPNIFLISYSAVELSLFCAYFVTFLNYVSFGSLLCVKKAIENSF